MAVKKIDFVVEAVEYDGDGFLFGREGCENMKLPSCFAFALG